MRGITVYSAIALSTFVLGTSITKAWNLFLKVPRFDSSSSVTGAMPTSEVEQELFEIARQYDIAQTNQDAAFFEKLETDNFILTYADGSTLTRAQDIALMKSWDQKTKFVATIYTCRSTATRQSCQDGLPKSVLPEAGTVGDGWTYSLSAMSVGRF